MSTKPRLLLLASVLAVLPLVGTLAQPADAGGSAHPYFNDQGTLTWYHSLAEAQRAAKREGKLIFVEYGRRVCTQCKVLCARILPHPSIRGRVSRVAVGLAAECDRPEPAVQRLFRRHLRNARTLPFVAFLTPEGRWVTGFAGRTSVSQFSGHMALAERMQTQRARRVERPRKPVAAPVKVRPPPRCRPCPPCPTPAPVPPRVPEPTPEPDTPIEEVPAAEFADFPPCSPDADAKRQRSTREVRNEPQVLSERSAPKGSAKPVIAVGSPDAGDSRHLPAPVIRPSNRSRTRVVASGDPDGGPRPVAAPRPQVRPQVRPHGRIAARRPAAAPGNRAVAVAAAARGNWGEVIRHTRGGVEKDPELRGLNRRAHAWAHERLAAAVRALRAGRYGDAGAAVSEVRGAMRGEPEAIDADRGAEALELMQDLQHLSADSAVRRAVRKTAYEKMRGTRWAPLFSDCPTPSRSLSQR